jgi:bifunctional non-homologous end joining protein LigD
MAAAKRGKAQAAGGHKTKSGISRDPKGARAALDEYRHKRNFSKTAEPAGSDAERAGTLRFVVQKHAARNVHFDLRLELDGVMKSWAVPKGPSVDPSVKRLAMQVEDHPIEYNTFEGTIPHGEYGGGTVMLWDRGTYIADPATADGATDEVAVQHGYQRGDLKVVLDGQRLHGSWVLVRTRFGPGSSSGKPSWLLIKHRDAYAKPGSDIVADVSTSVASGRTMDEIAAAGDGDNTSAAKAESPKTRAELAKPTARKAAAKATQPRVSDAKRAAHTPKSVAPKRTSKTAAKR